MPEKTVLITGTGRRLGFYLTEAFLIRDWNVIALTRHNNSREFVSVKSERLDVIELGDYDSESLGDALRYVSTHYSRMDAIIHNASIYEPDEAHASDFDGFYEKLFHIHMRVPAQINTALKGCLYNTQKPGNIVHITDIYADNPNPDYGLYCSTKAGLENLSKSFAKRFAPGIRVNTIQPGPIKFLAEHTQEQKENVLSETLLEGEGGFQPIYKAILAILDNPYMTGTSLRVDGGRSLNR